LVQIVAIRRKGRRGRPARTGAGYVIRAVAETAAKPSADADPSAALPPSPGHRGGAARARGRILDGALDLRQALLRTNAALDQLAAKTPVRRVAVLGVYGPDGAAAMRAAADELRRSRHTVEFALGSLGPADPALADVTRLSGMEGGKLANANRLAQSLDGVAIFDWVLVIDDDAALPAHFLDRLLALGDRFSLDLVQPGLTRASHTAWSVVRRRPAVLRETRFVEMGPVLAMSRRAFAELNPFPEEGMGWGADLHWAAVAKRLGWRMGVADAVPVRHDLRSTATGYDAGAAREGAARLLAAREHIGWSEAGEVIATHRRLRG
jgi:hypothetical protein